MSQQQYPYSAPQPGGFGPPVPPQRGGPPGPAPQQPTGTNVMAILAIVFAFVFSPLGIVFGIVGRRQTQRTGQPGRGLATTGLVLSVVFLLIGIAAAAYAIFIATQIVRTAPTTTFPDVPGVSAPADTTAPVVGPAGSGTVATADGDYGPELPPDALAAEIGTQTGAADVICPGYLPAQVEASSTCDGTVDGRSARFRATVTAVAGPEASIDIAREQ